MSTDKPTPLKLSDLISKIAEETAKEFAALERQRDEYARQLAEVTRERDVLISLAYETRPGMPIGPVTWQECCQQALKSYYDEQEKNTQLRAELVALREELQKVCDHEWIHQDNSFDHEFGTEQVHSYLCEKCGLTKPYEPETFGDEAI